MADKPLPASPERRNDLWIVGKVFDYGPEKNLQLWRDAKHFVDGLTTMVEQWDANSPMSNDALIVALSDCFNRTKEEVKRHEAELEMRREWAAQQPRDTELQV